MQPEELPEWARAGESVCFASAMPWAGGAYPLLAVCCDGLPLSLQANPLYQEQAGLPAHVQASLLDLYSPQRPDTPTLGGKKTSWQGMRGSFRAWARALKAGRKTAFLFPAGYSAVRAAQVRELSALAAVDCFAYDPVAEPRAAVFEPLSSMQRTALGEAVAYPTDFGTLAELTARLPEYELLFIFTPADPAALNAEFAHALEASRAETVRFSLRPADETGKRSLYTIPLTHFLEEWGAEADAHGNLCLRQPVVFPLVAALSEAEALHALLQDGELPPEKRHEPSTDRDRLLQACPQALDALKKGYLPGAAPLPTPLPPAGEPAPYLHPLFVDGRYRHNAWLKEAYDPLSGAAGAPAVYLPGEATEHPHTVQLDSYTLPAQAIPGLKRTYLPLLPGITADMQPTPVSGESPCPGRPLRTLPPDNHKPVDIPRGTSPQWGLVIDYTLCVGCNACTLACRAENNIPTVGASEQQRGRDLQWLRIDRYLEQDRLHFVPATCRQCQNAPCEAVCPVNATVHTGDGLNAMVYPRCWGTRYCAAACPYHARSFNFHDYARRAQTDTALPPNPQVTVRSRGVMEKCTCCIQRIQAAKLRGESAPPRTACQIACPRGAIRLINWAEEAPPSQLTTRFDTPGTKPATVYRETNGKKNCISGGWSIE